MASTLVWVLGGITASVWGGGVLWTARAVRARLSTEQELAAMGESVTFAWSEKRLLETMERFPLSSTPAVVYARHAQRRREFEEALLRFQVAIKRNRKDPRGYAGAAASLRGLKRLDESNALLRQADKRCPKLAEVQQEFAWNAVVRQDWAEAERRWALHREYVPKDKMGYEQGQIALRRLGRAEEADALAVEQKAMFRERFSQDATSA